MVALRRWFVRKFRRPLTSEEWLTSYPDELAVMMFEDILDEDEELAKELRLKHLGYEVALTGDPLVDMWERQIAQGVEPDLDYEEPENSKERDRKIREDARRHYAEHGRDRLYRAPVPDQSLSIEDIERRREGMMAQESIESIERRRASRPPDMRAYGAQEKDQLLFDDMGYPIETSDMSPALFDHLGNVGSRRASQRAGDDDAPFSFHRMDEFARVGEEVSKKKR